MQTKYIFTLLASAVFVTQRNKFQSGLNLIVHLRTLHVTLVFRDSLGKMWDKYFLLQLSALNNKFHCLLCHLSLRKNVLRRETFASLFSLFYIYFIAVAFLGLSWCCMYFGNICRLILESVLKEEEKARKNKGERFFGSLSLRIKWDVFEEPDCCLVRMLNWINASTYNKNVDGVSSERVEHKESKQVIINYT